MSERTVQTVECELCGESFDPTDAGGWCTNPDCGEWKYAGGDLSDGGSGDEGADADAATDEGDRTTTDESVDDAGVADADAETPDDAADDAAEASEAVEEPDAADESDAEGPGTNDPQMTDSADEPDLSDAGDEAEASEDESDVEADATADAAADAADATAASEDDVGSEADADDADTVVECVDCGAEVERDANFCPTCGGEVVERQVDENDELTECPACGGDVEPEDNFCASCGEDLEAHRASEKLTECPDCGADVEEDDAFCAKCGEDLDAHRGDDDTSDDQDVSTDPETAADAGSEAGASATSDTDATSTSTSAPDSLSLTAYGRSIEVEDGDAIGREVRSLLAEAGRPDDEAVRIHREHVRFVREDDQFYLVDLGDNPTAVEGRTLSKGDREPIAPGDEVTLSEVVTLTVESPDA